MSNVGKIGQETKSLKTIQYNPIGLVNMGSGHLNAVSNLPIQNLQMVSP